MTTYNNVLPKAGLEDFDWAFVSKISALNNTQTAQINYEIKYFPYNYFFSFF